MVGERVVASMMRTAKEGEFRSNIHRGGRADKVRLTPEERSTAVRSAKAMGLRIADGHIVVFDRNGFIYHGRVKAVADAAREAGLKF